MKKFRFKDSITNLRSLRDKGSALCQVPKSMLRSQSCRGKAEKGPGKQDNSGMYTQPDWWGSPWLLGSGPRVNWVRGAVVGGGWGGWVSKVPPGVHLP